jgi:hypothetical protein
MQLKTAVLWTSILGARVSLLAEVPPPQVSWRKTIEGSRSELWPFLVRAPGGGYVLLANSQAYGECEDLLLLKVSSEGVREWETRWGGPENDVGASLDGTNEGDFIVAVFCSPFLWMSLAPLGLAAFCVRKGFVPMRSGDKVYRDQQPRTFWLNVRFMLFAGALLYGINVLVAWVVMFRPR